MAVHGHLIIIAEVRLTPASVTWRVASGPSGPSVGLPRWSDAGVLSLRAWEGHELGPTAESVRGIQHAADSLARAGRELLLARPLPLGSMS